MKFLDSIGRRVRGGVGATPQALAAESEPAPQPVRPTPRDGDVFQAEPPAAWVLRGGPGSWNGRDVQ